MLRIFKKRIGTFKRFIAVTPEQRPTETIISLLKQYQHDKAIMHSKTFLALEQVFNFHQIVEQKMKDLTELQRKLASENGPINAVLIKEYFNYRKEFGFNEVLLAHILKLICRQKSRGFDFIKIGTDLYGRHLLRSPLFTYIIDEIKMMLTNSLELDLDALDSILESLTALEYKDNDFMLLVFTKLQKMTRIFNPEFELIDNNLNEHFLKPSLKNYNNVLSKESFKKSLASIICIKNDPGDVSKAYQEIKSQKEELEIENLDDLLERMGDLLKNFAIVNLDFFHTINSIREYYFDLKEGEKNAFIKENPNLYLDFLKLERKLIVCGFLMPKDLLNNESDKNRELGLIIESFLLQQQIDPDFVINLISNSRMGSETKKSEDSVDFIASSPQNTHIKKETVYFSILKCIDRLFNMAMAKYLPIETDNIYKYPSFKRAFGDTGNAYKEFMDKNFPRLDDELVNMNPVMSEEKLQLGHFGYTNIYQNLCESLENLVNQLKSYSDPDSLKLDKFPLLLLLQTYVITRKAGNTSLSEEIEQMLLNKLQFHCQISDNLILVASNNIEHLSDALFQGIIVQQKVEAILLSLIHRETIDQSKTLNEKISILFFGISASQFIKSERYAKNLTNVLYFLLNEENLQALYDSRFKEEIPLPPSYIKYFFVFDFARSGISVCNPKIVHLFEKVFVKIRAYLDLDYKNTISEDPAFSTINLVLQNWSVKNNSALAKTYTELKLILPLFPNLILNGHRKVIYLLKSNQHSDSAMSTFYGLYFRRQFGSAQIEFVNIREFFESMNYQKDLNFNFRKDLSEFIKSLTEIDPEKESTIALDFDSFLEALDFPSSENNQYFDFATSLVLILVNLKQKNQKLNPIANPKENLKHIQLFYFYVCYAIQTIENQFKDKPTNKLKNLKADLIWKMKLIKLPKANDEIIKLKNRNFGLELYDSSSNEVSQTCEFLNLKLFSKSSYFVFENWKKELIEVASIVQFYESDLTFFNRFAKLKKIILPNVAGRKLTSPNFQMFWEDILRPSSEEVRKNAIKYDLFAGINRETNLSEAQMWKYALLNFLYELRSKEDLPTVINQLVQLPFWNNLFEIRMAQQPITQTQNLDLISFDKEELGYFFDTRKALITETSEYKQAIESKIELRNKIDQLKHKIEVEIPESFKLADSEAKRARIYDDYFLKKHEYYDLLQEYEKQINPCDSMYDKAYFKDLIFKIESQNKKEGDIHSQLSQRSTKTFFNDEFSFRSFTENLSLDFIVNFKRKFALTLTKPQVDFEKLLEEDKFIRLIRPQYSESPYFLNMKIEQIFTQADYSFFKDKFPFSEIDSFRQRSISDFLCVFATIVESKKLIELNNQKIASLFSGKLSLNPKVEYSVDELAESLIIYPNNALKFYLNYLEHKTWHQSLKISESDLKILKKMLSLMRSFFISGVSG